MLQRNNEFLPFRLTLSIYFSEVDILPRIDSSSKPSILSDNQNLSVRFEAFTAVTMKNVVFWDVALCRSCVNRRFGGMYRIHLQGRKIRERWTSVSRWLQRHIPEDDILQNLITWTVVWAYTTFLKKTCFQNTSLCMERAAEGRTNAIIWFCMCSSGHRPSLAGFLFWSTTEWDRQFSYMIYFITLTVVRLCLFRNCRCELHAAPPTSAIWRLQISLSLVIARPRGNLNCPQPSEKWETTEFVESYTNVGNKTQLYASLLLAAIRYRPQWNMAHCLNSDVSARHETRTHF
jgi:hypothetical protein